MNGYREFWNQLFYGSKQGFAGMGDIADTCWNRACRRSVPAAGRGGDAIPTPAARLTAIALAVWVLSVGPFVLWAASCPGCGSASSYDSARSYEAMAINQAWGGMLATAIAAVWVGQAAIKRLR